MPVRVTETRVGHLSYSSYRGHKFIKNVFERTIALKILGVVLLSLAVIYLLVLSVVFYRQGRFVKAMLITAASGIAAMLIVNLISRFTGVRLPYNPWTVGVGALMGLPGIIALMLINLFF